jgi:hypothetical protein
MRRVMQQMLFSSQPKVSLYSALLEAMDIHGRRHRLVEDVKQIEYTYGDILISATKDGTVAANAGAAFLVYGNTSAYFTGIATSKVIDLTKTDSFGRVAPGTTFPTFSGSNYGGAEGAKILGLAAADNLGNALAGGRDFDGDGREDLILAQNFFPTENATMRFDAGVGIVLLGDGQGGFRALGVREAGLVVRGDQRGSALADVDGEAVRSCMRARARRSSPTTSGTM